MTCSLKEPSTPTEESANMEDYPNMYMTGFYASAGVTASNSVALGTGVCVKTCPSTTEVKDAAWWKANCKGNANIGCDGIASNTLKHYESVAIERMCMSTDSKEALAMAATVAEESGMTPLEDIGKAFKAIIILTFTGLGLSFGWLWLLSNFARCMTYTLIGLLLFMCFGGGAIAIIIGVTATSVPCTTTTTTSSTDYSSASTLTKDLSASSGLDADYS